MLGVLFDERTILSFTIDTGPHQRSHSRVRVPWDSRPYFTVSDSRLLFSPPPTTRRATVEVFDPASARELLSWVWVWVLCYDRRSVGQSVLEQSTHPGPTTIYLLVFDNYSSEPYLAYNLSARTNRKHSSCIIVSGFVDVGMCLPRLCVATTSLRTIENAVPLLLYQYCVRVCRCGKCTLNRYLDTAVVLFGGRCIVTVRHAIILLQQLFLKGWQNSQSSLLVWVPRIENDQETWVINTRQQNLSLK
jgi:hypothetical protein